MARSDSLRSCVAIVYSKHGRIAIAITVDDMPTLTGRWTIQDIF